MASVELAPIGNGFQLDPHCEGDGPMTNFSVAPAMIWS